MTYTNATNPFAHVRILRFSLTPRILGKTKEKERKEKERKEKERKGKKRKEKKRKVYKVHTRLGSHCRVAQDSDGRQLF